MEALHEEYTDMDSDEVMRISDYLLKKYRRAFIALANAESIEDGKKYFTNEENSAETGELLTYEDVKAISDELIEQNMEAYRTLANS